MGTQRPVWGLPPPSSCPTGRIDAGSGREEARQPSNWSPRPTAHGRRRIPGAGEVEGRCHCWWEGASVPPGTRKVGLRPCSVVASVLSLSFSRPCGEAGSLGLGGG